MKEGGALRAPFENKNEGRGAPRPAAQNKSPTGTRPPGPPYGPRAAAFFADLGPFPGGFFGDFRAVGCSRAARLSTRLPARRTAHAARSCYHSGPGMHVKTRFQAASHPPPPEGEGWLAGWLAGWAGLGWAAKFPPGRAAGRGGISPTDWQLRVPPAAEETPGNTLLGCSPGAHPQGSRRHDLLGVARRGVR